MVQDGYMTVKDVAEYLQIHTNTVIRAIKDGKLKAIQIGDTFRIEMNDLFEYIRQCEYKAK